MAFRCITHTVVPFMTPKIDHGFSAIFLKSAVRVSLIISSLRAKVNQNLMRTTRGEQESISESYHPSHYDQLRDRSFRSSMIFSTLIPPLKEYWNVNCIAQVNQARVAWKNQRSLTLGVRVVWVGVPTRATRSRGRIGEP